MQRRLWNRSLGLTALVMLTMVVSVGPARARTPGPERFTTPQDAVQALVAACKENRVDRLISILGPQGRALVESGDPVADERHRKNFAKAAQERTFYVHKGDSKVIVNVGYNNWPMPIPLVKHGASWLFDAAAGRQEMLDRRIGRDELSTISTCRAIVDAQRKYYLDDMDGNGVLDYALYFASRPGTRNGLYWPAKPGQPESPLGPLVAEAQQQGYTRRGAPYHGYYYRILKAQGRDARGGAYRYVANGNMVGGFAVVAWPAQYRNSGVMTFLVNTNGVIYEKDLGPRTGDICRAMKAYNPDETWIKVK